MNIVLWTLQALLALVFVGAGGVKTTLPLPSLAAKLGGWVHQVPLSLIRLVGVAEILGAAGLVLPRAFDVDSFLTPIAAVGLAVTMVGAIVIHGRRGETKEVSTNVVLFALCLVVAAGAF